MADGTDRRAKAGIACVGAPRHRRVDSNEDFKKEKLIVYSMMPKQKDFFLQFTLRHGGQSITAVHSIASGLHVSNFGCTGITDAKGEGRWARMG